MIDERAVTRAGSESGALRGRAPAVLLYFSITHGSMLLLGGLAALSGQGRVVLPVPPIALVAIGGLGPTLGAIIAAASEGGAAAVRALLAQVGRWRVPPIWYATALLGPALVMAIAFLMGLAVGAALPPTPPLSTWTTLPLLAVVYFVIAVIEELGWRGYAQPRLQLRFGALGAAVLVGILWAVWHLPQWWIPDTGQAEKWPFLVFAVGTVAQAVGLAWLYTRTGGSVLLVAIAHAAVNLVPEPWASAWRLMPEAQRGPYPSILIAAAWVATAALLVALTDPRTFSRRR